MQIVGEAGALLLELPVLIRTAQLTGNPTEATKPSSAVSQALLIQVGGTVLKV